MVYVNSKVWFFVTYYLFDILLRRCQLQNGTCVNEYNRHPAEKCLICNSNGNWTKQPRSKLIDAFGETLLNTMHFQTQNVDPTFNDKGKLLWNKTLNGKTNQYIMGVQLIHHKYLLYTVTTIMIKIQWLLAQVYQWLQTNQ